MARDDPRRFPFPPAIPAITLVVSWLMGRVWPPAMAWPSWVRIVGGLLAGIGVVFAVSAVLLFRRRRTPIDPRGKVTHVVDVGPYAFTRNPMYVSLMLIYIGATLAFELPWAVAWLIPVFLALHYGVVMPEEHYMLENFGDDYRRYTRTVRRWL